MAVKHDSSKTKQSASTANTTNNVTKTIADSYNQTLNLVTNTTQSTDTGKGLGLAGYLMLGGGAVFFLFVLAIMKR